MGNVINLASGLIYSIAFPACFIFTSILEEDNKKSLSISIVDTHPIEIRLEFLIDKIAISFCRTILLISGTIFLYSLFYLGVRARNLLSILLLIFTISILILVFRANILSLIIGWDGLGILSFLLVIFYKNRNRIKRGIITILTNRLGDSFIILTICNLLTYNYELIQKLRFEPINKSIFLLFLLGRFTKRAQYPFSS